MKIRSSSRINKRIRVSSSYKKKSGVKHRQIWTIIWQKCHRFTSVFALIAIVLVAGTLFWKWVSNTTYLSLRTIKVEPSPHVSQEEGIKISGLVPGTNILSIDTDSVAENIRKNPWIRDVSVKRKLPDSIHIKLFEYVPVAQIKLDSTYLVDKDGYIFKKVGKNESFQLPTITGASREILKAGKLPEDKLRVLSLIALAGKGPRTLGTGNIKRIELLEDNSFLVYTTGQEIVFHFGPSNLKQEFRRAEKILYHLYRSGLYKKVAKVDLEYGPDLAWAQFDK